jgi:hypothetical protein
MPGSQPQPQTAAAEPHPHHHKHTVYAREATGLFLIALVLLVLTVIRYWEHIHWNIR